MATAEATVENAAPTEPPQPAMEEGEIEAAEDRSLKRKASIDNHEDVSPKRTRHDNHGATTTKDDDSRSSISPSRTHTKEKVSRDDENRRIMAAQEEKRRGKRLFGGLMSTLSQTSNNSQQQRRRQEIERRQQERIQKQREEADQERVGKRERLREIRVTEQIAFEEQVMKNRHTKWLAMARFLHTRSDPRIYYLPWKTTPEQEDTIDDQIRDAKASIARELEHFMARKHRHVERYGVSSRHHHSPTPEKADTENLPRSPGRSPGHASEIAPEQQEEKPTEREHHHHHDESGDVLVEAEEDMVIY